MEEKTLKLDRVYENWLITKDKKWIDTWWDILRNDEKF